MNTPKPGQTWIDLRPMTDRAEWRDAKKFRRYVTVTSFEPHGHCEGISGWQKKARNGQWVGLEYPPPRRTRILAHVFVRRFVRAEES